MMNQSQISSESLVKNHFYDDLEEKSKFLNSDQYTLLFFLYRTKFLSF